MKRFIRVGAFKGAAPRFELHNSGAPGAYFFDHFRSPAPPFRQNFPFAGQLSSGEEAPRPFDAQPSVNPSTNSIGAFHGYPAAIRKGELVYGKNTPSGHFPSLIPPGFFFPL